MDAWKSCRATDRLVGGSGGNPMLFMYLIARRSVCSRTSVGQRLESCSEHRRFPGVSARETIFSPLRQETGAVHRVLAAHRSCHLILAPQPHRMAEFNPAHASSAVVLLPCGALCWTAALVRVGHGFGWDWR